MAWFALFVMFLTPTSHGSIAQREPGSRIEEIFDGNHHDSCVCQLSCSPPDSSGAYAQMMSNLISSQNEFQNSIESQLSRITHSVNSLLSGLQVSKEKQDAMELSVAAIKGKVDLLTPPPAFKVFLVSSPLGAHRLTFTQATELCQAKDAALATHAQLDAAWGKGMDSCSCGWLEDGSSRYPIQWPRNHCGGRNTAPGLRTCSDQNTGQTDPNRMWNAYCYKW